MTKKLNGKRKIEFTVHAPILGYRQTTTKSMFHKNERERSKAYGAFKEKVLFLAIRAGVPNSGIALKERPPRLSVKVYWNKEPRLDFKNVYGAIEDSIWYEWDRHVIPGKHSGVVWDSGKEEAVVTVELS